MKKSFDCRARACGPLAAEPFSEFRLLKMGSDCKLYHEQIKN